MFYQCPKCKKTWQHPIEKCPDCFELLERMASQKIKVSAVSKISVPSLAHPKIPYFTLILEDEAGNKWAQKSFKEYQAGQEFSYASSKDPNAVAIWRIKYDLLEAIEKLVDLLGGLEITPETKILVLPALNAPKHSYFGENTTPEFLEQTIQYLISRGAGKENIQVAGQSFNDIPIEACAQKSGLLKVCLKYNIVPLDLAKNAFTKKNGLEISENIFSADLAINLAALKIGQACASENLFKFLKKENYLGLKYLYGQKEIFEKMESALPKILTIAEADRVQTPEKFISFLGLALAGSSSLNIDAVFSQLRPAKALPEILSDVKIGEVIIVGRTIEEAQFDNKNI
ncbi:MAG: DUF362 domain-containing protein [Candidatus Paceibacterota bacterium]|jgi:hypothetical protein